MTIGNVIAVECVLDWMTSHSEDWFFYNVTSEINI